MKWVPLWAIPIVIALAVGTVFTRLSVIRTSYELDQTQKLLQNAQSELEKLNVRIAKLRSPDRLRQLAETRFHLKAARSEQMIYLRTHEAKTTSPK